MSHAAFALGFFQLFFVVNLFVSARRGRKVDGNPWEATTLEWSPAGATLRVYRDPYEYSVPGATTDFLPQSDARP
jgi:cytochrome c oxidase subunit 1